MKDQKRAQEIAEFRFKTISPILSYFDDPAKARQVRKEICKQTGISDRTIRRYIANYDKHGYEGLKPKGKTRKGKEAIPQNILEQAILLRREQPGRSVAQIIQILEWEEHIEPGQIKRSTLQAKLAESGYSTRQMKMYAEPGVAARRFQRSERCELWQSDIKFGPYLPVGDIQRNGQRKPKQVYLVTFLDDATRYVLHAEFYSTQEQSIVEDCFYKSIMSYGVPDSVYFDRGKQYLNNWMFRTCGKLEIKLLFTRPYSPESSGKIERYHQEIDRFLAEAALEKIQSLDELNRLFWVWLDECYQNRPHSALENKSPQQAFNMSKKPLKFVDQAIVADAFLHMQQRKVDKSGCISFNGVKYEVGVLLIGCKVDVIYDPNDTSVLTIEYKGHEPIKAKPLVIGERTAPRPELPEHLLPKPAESSRVLRAAEKRNLERQAKRNAALSFRKIEKEGE